MVPPVYCRKSKSSPVRSTGVRCNVLPSRKASLKRVNGTEDWISISPAATGPGRVSQRFTTMTFLTVVPTSMASRVGSALAMMTIVWTPASLIWCNSSCGVYVGLTFTWAAPARSMPNIATGNAGILGSITATRSPRCTPLC
ncbi:hypothetical protein D3C76_1253790 [compost metagenome]